MSRFLFVVPPLAGHTFPTVAVGRELTDRGHIVAWAGHPKYVAPLLPAGVTLLPVDETLTKLRRRPHGLRGAAAFRFLWQEFLIPLAHSMVPGTTAAVDEFRPDVMVVDQQTLAGALVARRRGLPWATSATTSAELTDQFATMPRLAAWVRQCVDDFQFDFDVSDPIDLRFSDQLVLAFTTEMLVGPPRAFPGHFVFVGPSIGARADTPTFPWDWLDPARRHVLVSLGTVNPAAGQRFFATTVEAVAPLAERLQVILVASPDLIGPPPDHVLVRGFVPQLDLLPVLDAVICHGGHNTVCETLAHGVPLVVAPIRDDQPVIARQVADAGAGIRVHFGRVGSTELRHALTTLLDDPSYRAAARRVQTSFATAGGATAAADHLEKLT
ncbi:MAG: glycosyl transferase [Pseudonocardiales bacterium]|nr:glycosyltransferase [Actinomycetota bacterium]PZS24240.1 MAG: glycosyl transferase [Pseudonocardiales bacterium]